MASSKEPLSFVSLEVQNILRLKAFKMTMGDDGLVVIEAKNSQGKSSALYALEMALAGMSDAPPEPLHGDAKKGYVIATFDGIVVKRVFRASKPPALTVTLPDGTKVKGPQTFLDALFTKRCFRPTKLMDVSEKDQVAIVSEIMGFDPSEFNAEIESVFNDRTDANREAKRLAAVVTETTFCEDAPDEEISVSELMAELQSRQHHNFACDNLKLRTEAKERALADAKANIDHAQDVRNECAGSVAELEERLSAAREQVHNAEKQIDGRRTLLTEAQGALGRAQAEEKAATRADAAEIANQIATADDINRKVRANIERAKAKGVAAEAAKDAGELDAKLAKLKDARTAARLEARDRLAVPGLDMTEDRLLFNGKPFSQAGNSDQLRVCVSVAIKGNEGKRGRVLLIDDGEKLDADGVAAVMTMARDAGYPVIMTKVIARTEDASETSVVIEDGEVKA